MPDLIIQKDLPKIALLSEGAKISISADNPFTEGVIGKTVLEFLNFDTYTYTDQKFTLSWNGIILTFTFRTNPDDSGIELHDNNAMVDPLIYLPILINDLNRNFYINRDFIVTGNYIDYKVIFTCRKMGDEFNIALSDSDVSEMSVSSQTIGSPRTLLSNYAIFVQPRILTDNFVFSEALGTEAIKPNSDFIANFDIAEYFNDLLSNSFQFPDPQNNIYAHPEASQKYFIVYGDKYNGQFKKQYDTMLDPRVIIKGGLSKIDRQFYTDHNIEYFDYGSNARRFLTWHPLSKRTTKQTPERLYFFNQDHSQIKLCIDATERDGSTYTLILAEMKTDPYLMLEFVVDYYSLQIPSFKDVVCWNIYLTDGSDTISEIRHYELDESPYIENRHFLFRNSLDTYDSFYTSGLFEKEIKLKKDVVDSIEIDEFTTHKSLQKHFNTSESQTFKANTGFLTEEELDHKREFLLSEEVFQVSGAVLIPVIVTSTKAIMYQDREHIYHLEFTYEYAFNDKRFSREIQENGLQYLMLGDNFLVFDDGADRLRY